MRTLIGVLIVTLPPLFWGAVLALREYRIFAFRKLTAEDGPIEDLQAVVLVLACLAAAWIAKRLFRAGHRAWAGIYAGFSVALFVLAGEEVSWGQRMLGIATPEWFMCHNEQQETSLHNLRFISYLMHTASIVAPLILICLSLVSLRLGPERRRRLRTELWVPSPLLIPAWLCFASYIVMRFHHELYGTGSRLRIPLRLSRLQEPAELILYAGVLVFLISVALELRKRAVSADPARA